MNLEMTPLEIVGLKTDLRVTVHALQRLGCVQIDELTTVPGAPIRPLTIERGTLRTQEELKSVAARVEGFLDMLGCPSRPLTIPPECEEEALPKGRDQGDDYLALARAGVVELTPLVQARISRREELQAELNSLPRYEATLRKLAPIVPPSASEPGNVSIGVLVSQAHLEVLDLVREHVLELTGGRAAVVAGDVDKSTRAMLLVFPAEFTGQIEALLGREDVSRLRLPAELGQGPPDVALAALHHRMAAIPEEIETIDRELAELAAQWCEKLFFWRATLLDELDAINVLSCFGETDVTFMLMGWIPAQEVEKVEVALQEAVGEATLVRPLPLTPELEKKAPVVLQNPGPARPFESLLGMLSLPRYGDLDPTRFMALFMPLFFGMMLGDVGYGGLLLALCLGLLQKIKNGIMRDLLVVLAMGGGWSILFGFLFGEVFGNLGDHVGLHPLWFNRASPDHIAGLLLMSLAVGAVHITLGLLLGVWEAIRSRSRSHLLERGGMLLGLVSLFFVAGVLADLMPEGFMTPAVAGLIVGIVLLGMPMGWMGVLLGPVEFIGLIGNVLSYLRIAAIGLASIYLAQVANDMAGKVGSLIVGTIVVVLVHALNLVMGAFSPTIHSLRLHYVEFFRKFYQGGGKPYEPFRSQLSSDVDSQPHL